MKHLKIFYHILHTFLILCNVAILASEYQSHYAQLDFGKTNNNVSLTSRISPRPNTSKQNKSYYPTREQLTIVMNWMQQLCPHKSYTDPEQRTSQCKQISQASPTIAPPSIAKQKYITIDTTDLENRLLVYQQYPEWDTHKHIIDERKNALDQIKNGNQKFITQYYSISEKMQQYCNAQGINSHTLELCQGDILQQTIHNEFVNITKKSAGIWHKNKTPKAFKQATNIIADFTDAGIACNNAQETHKALAIADACWMLLDCIHAAAEGLVEGAYHTVDDIIHPVRTVQNIAESIATYGYYIGKVALEVGELSYLIIAEPADKTHQKLDEWANSFAAVYDGIKEKSSSLKTRDIIKETVSLGTQFYTTPKALHGVGRLFKCAHKNAIKLAKNISNSAKANALSTPEGIIVRIADSTVEFMKNEQIQKLGSGSFVSKFIQENRIPIDKETILNSSNFRKTKIPPIKGAQVYTKDNLFYHRDTLHKGKRAHLEVYDKRGLHLGEADPLTGELIKNTADKTKKLFR